MARIGLVDRIHAAAAKIDAGRKGIATRGKEQEGRIFYEDGIAEAMSAFKEAQAIQYFDDAFLVLKVVEDSTLYKAVEQAIPHNKKYRVKGYPKDSFHIACGSHITRIKNMLRTPGIDPIEKSLLKQRLANLPTAQGGYIEKQKKALEN